MNIILGSALHKLKRYNEAINSFNEAIEIDQKNLLAYYNKGINKLMRFIFI
jgi:tetratricopeptide (TPR) repeat protein